MNALDRILRRLRPRKAGRVLACNELVDIITEYLEGTLPLSDRARFDAHLAQCQGCRIYLEQMRRTVEVLGQLSEESIPPRAREELLQAFRSWNRA